MLGGKNLVMELKLQNFPVNGVRKVVHNIKKGLYTDGIKSLTIPLLF